MTTNTNTNTGRTSYVLAGVRENQACAKATEVASVMSHAFPDIATMVAKAIAKLEAAKNDNEAAEAAKLAQAAYIATNEAVKAAQATEVTEDNKDSRETIIDGLIVCANVVRELMLNAMTVAGAYSYFATTLQMWVDSRDDIASATFERKETKSNASMQIIIVPTEGRKLYMSVNTTASIDWRKIDATYNRRRENQRKKAAEKAAKAAKREAEKAAKAAARKKANAEKAAARKLELARKRLEAAQAAFELASKAA